MNPGIGDPYYHNNRNRFCDRGRSHYRGINYNRSNQNFRGSSNFRDKRGKEMTEEFIRKETSHVREEETGIQMIEEGLGGAEVKIYLEIETGPVPGIE